MNIFRLPGFDPKFGSPEKLPAKVTVAPDVSATAAAAIAQAVLRKHGLPNKVRGDRCTDMLLREAADEGTRPGKRPGATTSGSYGNCRIWPAGASLPKSRSLVCEICHSGSPKIAAGRHNP
jgi:hypothetical protein